MGIRSCLRKSILSLVIFCSIATADVEIKKEHHIQNQDPGRCAWCSLESLGLTHGWNNLKGLADKNARAAYREDIIKELNKYKIDYEIQNPDGEKVYGEYYYYLMHQKRNDFSVVYVWECRRDENEVKEIMKNVKEPGYWWIEKKLHWDTTIIRKAIKDNLGAAVGLTYRSADPKFDYDRHMLVITHMDNDNVYLVDSNYPQGVVRHIPLYQFLEQWNGFAVIIKARHK